jgi:Bacterial TniB protein
MGDSGLSDGKYSHLDPRIRDMAAEDSGPRIRIIEKDLFIEHDYSRYLNSVLDEFMCGQRQTRMPCLLILGDAGMGKTAQLHRFQRHFPDTHDKDSGQLQRHIVMVNVPTEPTKANLQFALLDALGAPNVTRHRSVDQAAVIKRMLTAHRSKIVIFDEVQHICHTRSRDKAVVLDTLKSISTECQISVICAGTPSVEREFHADPQIERRFDITSFVTWSFGTAFKRFLETYERVRPLRLASNLTEPTMMREILAETGGVTHRIMQRLNAAAIVAIHEKTERITQELLSVKRLEPERVLQAKRASTIESVVEADQIRSYGSSASKREPRADLGL